MTGSAPDGADREATALTLRAQHDRAGDLGGGTSLPCRVNDPEMWFAESPVQVDAAKALCRGCPVRQPCLSGALERGEPLGVWGGELLLQGAVIPRKRARGRPPKHEVAA